MFFFRYTTRLARFNLVTTGPACHLIVSKFISFPRSAHNFQIMTIQRNLFFTNHIAFSIQATKAHIYDMLERLGEDTFPVHRYDSIIADLTDLEFLVATHPDDVMTDVFTGIMIPRDLWFLRYGIRDATFEYFNGNDDDTVHTFDVTDLSDDDSIIDSDDEMELVAYGTRENPIDLTESDTEI